MIATARPEARRWLTVRIVSAGGAVIVLGVLLTLPPLYGLIGLGAGTALAISLGSPVLGLCLLAFSVPWAGSFSLPVGSFPITMTEVVVIGVATAWLVSAVWERRSPIASTIWLPYLALFLVAIALSASQAADKQASAREIFKWCEMTLVYLAGVYWIRSRRQVAMIIAALVLAGVGEALLGYVQFLFHLGPEAFATGRLFLRAYGTFDQPNPYAGYLNIVLPFALVGGLIYPTRTVRNWYRVAATLMAGAILVSESRGALLAGVVAATVVLSMMYRQIFGLAWTGVFAILTGGWLALLGLVPTGPFQRLLSAIGLGNVSFGNVTNANFSAVEREAHWLAGIRMFETHPLLGVGIGNYAVAYPVYHPRGWYAALEHAHNYYINIAAEAGIVGLASYVLLAGAALWYSYAATRRAVDPVIRTAMLGVVGALIATNFHNLFDVLYVHGIVALLGLLLALVAASLESGSVRLGMTEPLATPEVTVSR